MSNAHDRIVERIRKHLDHVGRSPIDLPTLLKLTAPLESPPGALGQALQSLIHQGDLRRVGSLYIRVPARWPKQERRRSAA